MFKFKKSLAAFAGMALLLGVIALVTPRPTVGQRPPNVPPPQNVKVINSPSEPVPVTGTVSVSNLGGDPLPVRDVDGPNAGNIVTLRSEGGFFRRVLPTGATETEEFFVTPGKALIVTDVNWFLDLPATEAGETGGVSISLLTGTGPDIVEGDVYFGATSLGSDGNGGENDALTTGFVVAENVRIRPNPGSASMIIHGRLVDVP